jgi:F0F1-type ATP synthase assembly protein I
MIRASKVCGVLCWIFLVTYMSTALSAPDWLMAAISGGFILCAISAFLLYAFARRGSVPKSRVGLYTTISAVVIAVLLLILPLFG